MTGGLSRRHARHASALIFCIVACARPRPPLPPPSLPLILTPDAAFRAQPPAPTRAAPVVWQLPEQETLANGLTVIHQLDHSGVVSLELVCRDAGERGDRTTAGTAALTLALLADDDTAAASEPGLQFSQRLERDSAALFITVRPDDVGSALQSLADRVTRPAFGAPAFSRVALRQLNFLLHTAGEQQVALNLARRQLYGDAHPLGVPLEGVHDVIAKLKVEDLQRFHRAHYRPDACALILAGPAPSDAHETIVRALESWRPAATAEPALEAAATATPSDRALALVYWYGAQQSVVVVAHGAVNHASAKYPAMIVLEYLLGGHFRSRLNRTLREERGVTYGARAFLEDTLRGTTLFMESIVQSGEEGSTLQEMLGQMESLRRTPVPDDELRAAKSAIAERLTGGGDERGLLEPLATLFVQVLPLSGFEDLHRRIAALTPDDVQQAAHDLLSPDDSRSVVVGDPDAAGHSLVYAGFNSFDELAPRGR
jgi:zinc protease